MKKHITHNILYVRQRSRFVILNLFQDPRRIMLILLLCTCTSLQPKNYSNMSAQKAIDLLLEKQTENPTDPVINYNLGVAQYKHKQYAQASANFDRAGTHSMSPELRQKALFNHGNSLYAQALQTLGPDWEKQKPEQKILDTASAQAAGSVDKFKRAQSFDKTNERIQNNLRVAEELLKKLQKEKQKQDDKQEQDEQKNSQDQQKQDDKQKQDKEKQDEQKNPQDKKQDSKKDEQKQEDKQKQDDKQKQEQNQQKKEQQQKQDQKKPETIKTKNMRARLEKLQQNENDTQKKLIQMQSAQQDQPNRGQKPW